MFEFIHTYLGSLYLNINVFILQYIKHFMKSKIFESILYLCSIEKNLRVKCDPYVCWINLIQHFTNIY